MLVQSSGDGVGIGKAELDSDAAMLASAPVDWSSETYLSGAIEQVRFEVEAEDETAPVFVGLVPPEQLDALLSEDGRVVDEGYRFDYTEYADTDVAELSRADIWTARESGAGDVTLTFDAEEQPGERVLVVMSPDGQALEALQIESYATVASIGAISTVVLVIGAVLTAGSVVAIVLGVRRLRRAVRA